MAMPRARQRLPPRVWRGRQRHAPSRPLGKGRGVPVTVLASTLKVKSVLGRYTIYAPGHPATSRAHTASVPTALTRRLLLPSTCRIGSVCVKFAGFRNTSPTPKSGHPEIRAAGFRPIFRRDQVSVTLVYTMFVCGCSCVGVRCALTRLYLTLERLCGACVRCCDVIPVEGGRGNDS